MAGHINVGVTLVWPATLKEKWVLSCGKLSVVNASSSLCASSSLNLADGRGFHGGKEECELNPKPKGR